MAILKVAWYSAIRNEINMVNSRPEIKFWNCNWDYHKGFVWNFKTDIESFLWEPNGNTITPLTLMIMDKYIHFEQHPYVVT